MTVKMKSKYFMLACITFFYVIAVFSKESLEEPSIDQNDPFYSQVIKEADAFIQSLPKQQQKLILKDFNDPNHKVGFCYFFAQCPIGFQGVRLYDLNAKQKFKFHKLLAFLLSKSGYQQTIAVMNRQKIIGEMGEEHHIDPKDYPAISGPNNKSWVPSMNESNVIYYVIFFGYPASDKSWAIRIEGHHLSLNFTFVPKPNHQVFISSFPLLMGVYPVAIPKAPNTKTSWSEQQGQLLLYKDLFLAKRFVQSLSTKQRRSIYISHHIPVTFTEAAEIRPMAPKYLDVAKKLALSANQKNNLALFLDELIDVPPKSFIQKDIIMQDLIHGKLSWNGEANGDFTPFYLRLEGNRFLVEFLLQGEYSLIDEYKADHLHVAIRDLKNDWDADVLTVHLKQYQHHHPEHHN